MAWGQCGEHHAMAEVDSSDVRVAIREIERAAKEEGKKAHRENRDSKPETTSAPNCAASDL